MDKPFDCYGLAPRNRTANERTEALLESMICHARGQEFLRKLLHRIAANKERVFQVRAFTYLAYMQPKHWRCRWDKCDGRSVYLERWERVSCWRRDWRLREVVSSIKA